MDIKPSYNINNKKKRKRKTIWFNPPYSKSVKTNIERIFINLISKHFPPNHKFLKILDKDTTKFSYSCMPNTRPKINNHKKNTATQARQNYATALLKKIAYWMDYVSSILYQATRKCSEVQRNLWNDIQETFCKPQKNHST